MYELIAKINGESVLIDTDFGGDSQLNVAVTYQISDILDIATKNSSFSKTIILPDSRDNRAAFKYIFDINSDSTFDPRKKTKCYILRDTVIQFEGQLQLQSITYDRSGNIGSYQCVIYGDNDTLFKNIGDKLLSELNFDRFNHTYNTSNISGSWVKDYTNGWVYPLIDYKGRLNSSVLRPPIGTIITDFRPACYAKIIFDQIMSEAGYTYQSDILNSAMFKKLIIPHCNAQLTSTIDYTFDFNEDGTATGDTFGLLYTDTTTDVYAGLTLSGWDRMWNSFEFDHIQYDPNSWYDTSGHLYRGPSPSIPFAQRFSLNICMSVTNYMVGGGPISPWLLGPWSNTGSDDVLIFFKRSHYPNGTPAVGWSDTPNQFQLLNPPTSSAGGSQGWPYVPIQGNYYYSMRNGTGAYAPATWVFNAFTGDTGMWDATRYIRTDILNGASGSYAQPLRPGEEMRVFFMRYNYSTNFLGIFPLPVPETISRIGGSPGFSAVGSFLKSWFDPLTLTLNATLKMKDFIPANIKCKDFITSIQKMFNLYFEPDKDYSNMLRIEDRDTYYNKYRVIKDWRNKLDTSKPIVSQMLSDTQARSNKFNYKSDKDFYNTVYTQNTFQNYGYYEYVIDNDFIKDENKLEPIFSSTPIDLLKGSAAIYLPTIINYNNGITSKSTGSNLRLLYFDPKATPYGSGDQFFFEGTDWFIYPYAGPFDDPNRPTLSLNFGKVGSFYSNFVETKNNLFYKYWQNNMISVSDKNQRIVTAYFKLESIDISNFYFSDVVFVGFNGLEEYYWVNKIIDYDPASQGSTKVELIKAKNYNIH